MHLARHKTLWPLLVLAVLPAAASAAGLSQAVTDADRHLLDHAYYCETDGALQAIDAGANIDVVTSGGFTALMMAALSDCDDLAAGLIARGADLTAKLPDTGETALDIARDNSPDVAARLEAALGGNAAAPAVDPNPFEIAPGEPAAALPDRGETVAMAPGGPAAWPPLGYYQPGQQVLHTDTGVIWTLGTVERVLPDYGYAVDTDVPYRSGVVAPAREPFWTAWFFGDWRVRVPGAMTSSPHGNEVQTTITGGMSLPPLHIDPDGTYVWRIGIIGNEQVIEGSWEPNPDAPGVILRSGEFGADWLVANMTDNSGRETIKLYTPDHTGYQGNRL